MKQGMTFLAVLTVASMVWGRVDTSDPLFLGAMDQFIASIKQGDRFTHFETKVNSFEKVQAGVWWKGSPSNRTIYELSYRRTGGDLPSNDYYKCVTQLSQLVAAEGKSDIIIEEPACTRIKGTRKRGSLAYDKL